MLAGTMARKKNPINDIVDTVGGWLGGRGPGTNPQVQAAMQATRAIARTADTATGGFGQALLSDAQRMAMTGSSTPSALYKTAAVNLGAAAAGVGAAKVAGKVVGKVVESGVPARVANKLTGQTVIIHGTNVRGLKASGQKLMPNVPPARPEVGKVLFGVTPSPMYGPEEVARIAQHYAAQRSTWTPTTQTFSGSAYVAKVPTKALKREGVTFHQSTSPGKIVSEIPVSGSSPTPSKDFVERLEKAYKRAGGKFPKAPKEKKYKAPKNQPPVRS